MTSAQRRESFIKMKKDLSDDWRVVKPNTKESLIPFNSLTLDHVLRLYGLARNGTVYQIHGDEGAGKSTLGYAILREYQKATKEPVCIMDFERTFKSWYVRVMGVDESHLFVKQPDSIQDAVKIAVNFMEKGTRVFMFDSIPRMKSKETLESINSGDAFNGQIANHARAMSQFYDIILPHIAGHDGTLIMINQTRSRIEMTHEAQAAAKGYATVTNLNYSLPGGRANRYAVSCMIEMTTAKAWKPGKHEDPFILEAEARRGEEYLANEVRVRTLKNKITGTGYRQGSIWIRPGLGIDENISIRQIGRELGLIAFAPGKKWYVGSDFDHAIKVYDSKADAIEDLVNNENHEVLGKLKKLIIQQLSMNATIGKLEVSDKASRYLAGENDPEADEDNDQGPEGADAMPLTATAVVDDDV
jgi:RecA/RadA recombinase